MLGPDMLYEKIRPIKYLFIILFPDVVKAKIKLRYLAYIQALYKSFHLNKLKLSSKSIRFLHVCKQIILL